MDVQAAIQTAVAAARRIMPDLFGQQVYVVEPAVGSLVTPAMLGELAGCSFRRLAMALKPQLQAAGQWQGEGLAVVVDATRAAAERPWAAERAIVGLVFHELIHALDYEPAEQPEPVDHETEYSAFVDACDSSRQSMPEPIPAAFWSHGPTFIRMAAHCWYRSAHGVFSLSPDDILFGGVYPTLEALSAPGDYCADLWSEFEPLRRLPLASLKGVEPPAAFTARWLADQNRIYAQALATVEAA